MPASPQTEARRGHEPSAAAPEDGEETRNDIPLGLKWSLVDDRGVPYREFRRGLKPRWWRVWLEIGAGYAVIAAVLTLLVAWSPGFPQGLAAAAVGALLIGYAIQFLGNFLHEAGHYNLVPGRRRNDL